MEAIRFLGSFPSDTAASIKALVPGRNTSFDATVTALREGRLLVYTEWPLFKT